MNHDLNPLIENRFSPRSFARQPVTERQVELMLDAARRAPSASNVQPWRFVYAHRGEEAFDALADTLTGNNRLWAPNAPLFIVLSVEENGPTGNPNGNARYDAGQAAAFITLQAQYMHLYTHQMGGFDKVRARQILNLPESVTPLIVLAVGYLGNPEDLSPDLPETHRHQETRRSPRKPLQEIAFHGRYGERMKEEAVVM